MHAPHVGTSSGAHRACAGGPAQAAGTGNGAGGPAGPTSAPPRLQPAQRMAPRTPVPVQPRPRAGTPRPGSAANPRPARPPHCRAGRAPRRARRSGALPQQGCALYSRTSSHPLRGRAARARAFSWRFFRMGVSRGSRSLIGGVICAAQVFLVLLSGMKSTHSVRHAAAALQHLGACLLWLWAKPQVPACACTACNTR